MSIDPLWPPSWRHPTHSIPQPVRWPWLMRCPDCGQRFWGTRRTARRVTRYRLHWLRRHA